MVLKPLNNSSLNSDMAAAVLDIREMDNEEEIMEDEKQDEELLSEE